MAKWITDRDELGPDSFDGERLVVMSPDSRVRPRRLVVLAHGLGGSGAGTWGHLTTRLLHSQIVAADVAVLDYPSAWRAARVRPKLKSVVEGLVAELQALDYASVALVGHSMGGIVSAWTIRRWGEELTPPTPVQRVAGMIYVASPRLGSRWGGPPRERKLLRIHSEVQAENERFFATRVDVSLERHNAAQIKIPSFAAYADADVFVDTLSASAGIPSHQRISLPGSHRTVMKSDSFFDWLERRLGDLFDVHSRPLSPTGSEALTTEFRGDSARPEWDDAYSRALQRFVETNQLRVREAGFEDTSVGLRMRVVSTEAVLSGACQLDLAQDAEDQMIQRVKALGVAAYGAGDGATDALRAAVGSANQRWLEHVVGEADLEFKMLRWLDRVARNPMLERLHQQAMLRDLGTDGGLL